MCILIGSFPFQKIIANVLRRDSVTRLPPHPKGMEKGTRFFSSTFTYVSVYKKAKRFEGQEWSSVYKD
jgi:hypothetical protein